MVCMLVGTIYNQFAIYNMYSRSLHLGIIRVRGTATMIYGHCGTEIIYISCLYLEL